MMPSTDDLPSVIHEFEQRLPGWWWSIGQAEEFRHASCGPNATGPDAGLLHTDLFDQGFTVEDPSSPPGVVLRRVMEKAVVARAESCLA